MQNDLLLRTIKGEKVERPPVWLMRQAGRILPQYRALRASVNGFKALIANPELAAEVTIQPVDELGVDAAIIFSDILVIPECMGLDYEMIEKVGPSFPETIKTVSDITKLNCGNGAAENLGHIYQAIELTKKALDNRIPLIGFAGAPWTLLSYMVEGGGSKTFSKARKFLIQEEAAAHMLLTKLTDTIIAYLKNKIKAGVDVIQIFDSWAGILSPQQYEEFSLRYIKRICEAITEVPVIVFAKDAWFSMDKMPLLKADVIGIDWHWKPKAVREILGKIKVVQGNLDPTVLYGDAQTIENQTKAIIEGFGGHHIMNLGHGVYPDTPLENVKTFVNYVKSFKY
jgi:uroporphyrinogen decarboxylase